jgi:hypothetical protein
MKRLVVLFIISLTITYSNNLFALEKLYGGPTTIEQAKRYFFKNRKLDIIEGIWFNEHQQSYRAIVKEGDGVYSHWSIDNKGQPSGEGYKNNIVKSANDKIYIYHTFVNSPKTQNRKEMSGVMILTGNLIEFSIKPFVYDDGEKSAGVPNRKLIRIWPGNVYEYNANVQVKEESFNSQENKTKRSEKLSSKLNDNSSSTDYKSYWWVLVLLAAVAFYIYTQTTSKKKPLKKIVIKEEKEVIKPQKIVIEKEEKVSKLPSKVKKSSELERNSFFGDFFKGNLSLPMSFWGLYILGNFLNGILMIIMKIEPLVQTLFFLCVFLPFYIFTIIGTWKCATNYISTKMKKDQWTGWGVITYIVIVLNIINMIFKIFKALK